jgi:2-octaprenyl-6-methoxyphenol hydroxylase
LTGGALPVHLVEARPDSSQHPGFDARAIALAAGTCQQLARIGIWQGADCATPSSAFTSATAAMRGL